MKNNAENSSDSDNGTALAYRNAKWRRKQLDSMSFLGRCDHHGVMFSEAIEATVQMKMSRISLPIFLFLASIVVGRADDYDLRLAEMQLVADDFARFVVMTHYPKCLPGQIQVLDSAVKQCSQSCKIISRVQWRGDAKKLPAALIAEVQAEFVITPNRKVVHTLQFVEGGVPVHKHATHIARTLASYNQRLKRWTSMNPPSVWIHQYPLLPWKDPSADSQSGSIKDQLQRWLGWRTLSRSGCADDPVGK